VDKDKTILEQKDKNLMTPLSFASYYGKTGIEKYLIEQGADVNYQRGGNGESALHFAAYFDHIEIAKLLVEHGADINAGDGIFTGLSPDGKYLFFCGGDISWVDAGVIDKIRSVEHIAISSALLDTISKEGMNAAHQLYWDLKKEYPFYHDFSESVLNRLGYRLLGEEELEKAIGIFQLNVQAFPDSWNVYDSLGEAYMKKGDRELAIKSYQKSLELNPQNKNAVEMLKRLKDK
jgi:tetratricopeptide (TPR) repeat protein